MSVTFSIESNPTDHPQEQNMSVTFSTGSFNITCDVVWA